MLFFIYFLFVQIYIKTFTKQHTCFNRKTKDIYNQYDCSLVVVLYCSLYSEDFTLTPMICLGVGFLYANIPAISSVPCHCGLREWLPSANKCISWALVKLTHSHCSADHHHRFPKELSPFLKCSKMLCWAENNSKSVVDVSVQNDTRKY